MSLTNASSLKQHFIQLFGGLEERITAYRAPGRVNLIGEHIDYNGGYVFPAALTFGTTMLIRPRTDETIRMASMNFETRVQKSLSDLAYDGQDDWANFPKGIISMLQQSGLRLEHGYDLLFHGDIPNGAGLSSSASIEVVTAYGILDQANSMRNRTDIALLAQKTENDYIGVRCGIMDQFAIAQGRRDHAVLLRCSDLDYQHVPFDSGQYQLVIGNTNKSRQLAHSAYNERRSQCEQALDILQAHVPELAEIQALCQISPEQFAASRHWIEDEAVRRRAQHAVEENARVLRSVALLQSGDLKGFGQLMVESHASLRDLYEVSCHELNVMVDAALAQPGVLGSRMTGAGFGGCTVSIVHTAHIPEFIARVSAVYSEQTGLQADFYVCGIGDGVNRLDA